MQVDTVLSEHIRQIIAETLHIDQDDLPADVSQETYSRWTSLFQMTLMATLEDHFSLRLTLSEMMSMTSVPNIIAVLNRHAVTVVV